MYISFVVRTQIINFIFYICNILSGEGNGTPLQYSCLESPMHGGALWAAVHGVARSRTQLSDFTFTFHFHALEKEMATHSSVFAWRIPGMGEPGGLPSMGLHRVRHDWSDLAAAAAATHSQIILVLTRRIMMAKFGWKVCRILEYASGLIHGELTLFYSLGFHCQRVSIYFFKFSLPLFSSVWKDEKLMLFLNHKINLKIPCAVKNFNKNERLVSFHGMNENTWNVKFYIVICQNMTVTSRK